jgi:hypothetical protein
LNRKWQVYSFKILRMDGTFNQDACNYQTRSSDFYDPPSLQSCQADDVYDFTDESSLKIYSGSNKCMPNEANTIIRAYEHRGDSLFIDGSPYRIVQLSRDTLILDYCKDMTIYPPGPVVNRAKLGMKFIAVK